MTVDLRATSIDFGCDCFDLLEEHHQFLFSPLLIICPHSTLHIILLYDEILLTLILIALTRTCPHQLLMSKKLYARTVHALKKQMDALVRVYGTHTRTSTLHILEVITLKFVMWPNYIYYYYMFVTFSGLSLSDILRNMRRYWWWACNWSTLCVCLSNWRQCCFIY